jgi:hypothetical protein
VAAPAARQLHLSVRQNTLAAALKEWGVLRRTIHAAKYLSDPEYRRKISRQLNKGESLHALRRDLHYANQGTIRKVHLEQQSRRGRIWNDSSSSTTPTRGPLSSGANLVPSGVRRSSGGR